MATTNGSVLVTGALGCIGAWTVRELAVRGMPVVALDRSSDARRLELVTTPDQLEQVRLVEGDITDLSTVERVVVAENVTRIVHLGALQLPFCRADPPAGALVNVVGTVNIFEAARRVGLSGVVYTSSMAVFDRVEGGSVTPDTVARPASHYGAYKLANEGTARAYWEDFGVSSIGIRPMTVFGPGRDQGLTSSPTKAVVAAVLGCRYEIGFGGSTLFHYAPDAAAALTAAAFVPAEGARVVNLNGTRASISEVVAVLRDVAGEGADGITQKLDPLPFPDDIDTSGLEAIGPPPVTPLPEAVAATVEVFRTLQRQGRLVPEEHGLAVDGDVAIDAPAQRRSAAP
jgi:nucleoside-diphosphate-sugar epimerase